MIFIKTKVIFSSKDIHLAEELVSNLFYDAGLKGVTIEDPGIEPDEGWADDAYLPPKHHSVSGYFPKNSLFDEHFRILKSGLVELNTKADIDYNITCREIDEEEWAESWKKFFFPEKITPSITVKPAWQEYHPQNNEIVLEIDPGMAFGTGTHPTTSMCISLIEKYIKKGDLFLDVGSGSGILMLAAEKLGAGHVRGLDNDRIAVDITRQNMVKNQVAETKFQIEHGTIKNIRNLKFDLIVSNILANVIIAMLHDLKNLLAENGILVCSGFVEKNRQDVLNKMEAAGLKTKEVISKDNWVAIAASHHFP